MPDIPATSVTLNWMCEECRHNYDTVTTQPLIEHVQVGTPICYRCDSEMELMHYATTE